MRTLKKTLALVLVVAMMMSLCITSNAAFDDADEITYVEAVEVLTKIGVIDGFPSGDFKPEETLTRAQAAKIICYLIGAEDYAVVDKAVFEDVPANHWAASYIAYCVEEGIVDGYGDGKFGPEDALTGYQWAKMLLAAVGADTSSMLGAAWQIGVAKLAAAYGVFAGNMTADKTAEATREEACLYALNVLNNTDAVYGYAVLDANDDIVAIYPTITEASLAAIALGPQYDVDPNAVTISLLYDIHGVYRYADQDAWGRPGISYNHFRWAAPLSYLETPVATYISAVSECEIATAYGFKATKTFDVYTNGVINASTKTLNATATTAMVGAQGQLVEVYEDEIVIIDTFLAKVTKVINAQYDAAGHMKSPSKIEFTVYDGRGSIGVYQTNGPVNYSYAMGDMILVNAYTSERYPNNVKVTGNATAGWEVVYAEILGYATPAAGLQTAYSYVTKTSTVGNNVYSWANKYILGFPGVNYVTYNAWLDQYGNLIGLTLPTTATSVGIIGEMAWTNSYLPLTGSYAAANLVGIDAQPVNGVAVAGFGAISSTTGYVNVTNALTGAAINATTFGAYEVSPNVVLNDQFYNSLYMFAVNANGEYVIVADGVEVDGQNIVNAKANIWASKATNDNTVYLVKTIEAGKVVYNTYEGYKAVPSMGNVNVSYLCTDADAFVDYVYVDATAATYVGTSSLVYIADFVADGKLGLTETYAVQGLDGAGIEMAVAGGATLASVSDSQLSGLYLITTNKAGEITSAVNYFLTYTDGINGHYYSAITGYDGTVITDGTVGLNCTGAPIFKMVSGGIVPAATVAAGENAWCVIDAATGYVTFILVD